MHGWMKVSLCRQIPNNDVSNELKTRGRHHKSQTIKIKINLSLFVSALVCDAVADHRDSTELSGLNWFDLSLDKVFGRLHPVWEEAKQDGGRKMGEGKQQDPLQLISEGNPRLCPAGYTQTVR